MNTNTLIFRKSQKSDDRHLASVFARQLKKYRSLQQQHVQTTKQ